MIAVNLVSSNQLIVKLALSSTKILLEVTGELTMLLRQSGVWKRCDTLIKVKVLKGLKQAETS